MRRAVTSSQEPIDRFSWRRCHSKRQPKLRPAATGLRSTTLTSRGGAMSRYRFDHCFCGQIVRQANAVVKQSVRSCQSSLHLDNSRPDVCSVAPSVLHRVKSSVLWQSRSRPRCGVFAPKPVSLLGSMTTVHTILRCGIRPFVGPKRLVRRGQNCSGKLISPRPGLGRRCPVQTTSTKPGIVPVWPALAHSRCVTQLLPSIDGAHDDRSR
jgi:hypothetical protein